MIFRLRHVLADSPPSPAESDSLSCGLPFRFQLLSTPFHNDAVTFSYDVMAYADRDFHPVDKLPLWAHKDGEISPEAERKEAEANPNKDSTTGNDETTEDNSDKKKKSKRESKLPKIKIDCDEICYLNKDGLPDDSIFKGYKPVVVHNIIIKSDNVRYLREITNKGSVFSSCP